MNKKYCKMNGLNEVFEVQNIAGENICIISKNKIIHTKISNVEFIKNENININRGKYSLDITTCDVPSEIMLRHKFKEDAIKELDKYLDQAYLAKLGRVKIIHGRHGGILRNAVHEYLKHHPYVKEYYIASYSEGGIGVTIAILGNKKTNHLD